MPDDAFAATDGKTIGTRIREFRAIRDFSLTELGRRAHVSPSQLCRIETGSRSPSSSVIASVARALGVSVSVLHGQPYIHMLQKDQLDAMLAPISSALDSWDLAPDDDPPPRPLSTLEAETARVIRLRIAADFAAVAEVLPGLITEATLRAELHDHPGRNRERAHAVLAELARTAAIVTYRLGFVDMARLAVSRMAVGAPQSGDPCLVAIERFERAAITHAVSGRLDRGASLMRRALRDLDDDRTPATRAVRGNLLMRAAAYSARSDATRAADWMGQAAELAESIGDDCYEHSLMFGRFGVALAKMGVANDLDDHDEALRASSVRLSAVCPPALVGHFWLRKAQAQAWTARHDEALESLLEAKGAAPQLTRYHPIVHETVGTLLRARPRPSARLREYAQWSGV